MFKEYNVNIMKKEESQVIARLINENMKRKNDLQNLTYLGFEEYIFQACNYGYSKIGFADLCSSWTVLNGHNLSMIYCSRLPILSVT